MTKLLPVSLVLIALAPAARPRRRHPRLRPPPTTPVSRRRSPSRRRQGHALGRGRAGDQEDALLRALPGGRRARRREAVRAERGAHAVRDPRQEGEQDGAPSRGRRRAPTSSASRWGTRGRCGWSSSTGGAPRRRPSARVSETIQVVNWSAGAGSRGLKVLLLQRGLLKLGFATPVTGYFDGADRERGERVPEDERDGPRRLRHHLGLRDGAARPGRVQAALPDLGDARQARGVRLVAPGAGAGRPREAVPRVPRVVGQAVDADGVRQLPLLPPGAGDELARDGLLVVLHRRVRDPRLRRRCPNYAASHGCLRVPIPNAVSIYNWIDIGDPIYTYP